MDALTSLERAVVWRFVEPAASDLERFKRRIAADLVSTSTMAPERPFVVVTPAGARGAARLRRALAIRGATIVESRAISRWPRVAAALRIRRLDGSELLNAYAEEQVWSGLFPREGAELWFLDGERSYERCHAWRESLDAIDRGVHVTVQRVYDSFEADLPALHVPGPRDLEREWRILAALRAA